MKNEMKRVIAIHDLSCMGRCSLTVALPIISACGIETICMPTSILSTHTSGFTGFTCLDLTNEDLKIAEHWNNYRRKINAIYTGFLGSNEQIEATSKFITDFLEKDTVLLIDPVMADKGKLYAIFDEVYASKLSELSKKADILIPNVTEACIIAGIPYIGDIQTKEQIENLLNILITKGIKSVVLTSVCFEKGKIGFATKEKNQETNYLMHDEIDGYYHGTGDVFGSAFLSAYLNGYSLFASASIAAKFIINSINKTIDKDDFDPKYGVNFELTIPGLLKDLHLI